MKIKYIFQSFSLTQRMECCYLFFTTYNKAKYYWFFSFKWKCLLFIFHIDYILVFERNCLNRTYALPLTIPIEENQINHSEWKSNEKKLLLSIFTLMKLISFIEYYDACFYSARGAAIRKVSWDSGLMKWNWKHFPVLYLLHCKK